jgi:hypothetical protein
MGAELFHAEGRTDGRTDMAELPVAFRNFANALKTIFIFILWLNDWKGFKQNTKTLFLGGRLLSADFRFLRGVLEPNALKVQGDCIMWTAELKLN